MKTEDFYYDLPKELIAQTPAEPRDSSRMLVYSKKAEAVEHRHFYDLPAYLQAGDVLVINNTKVIPARLFGKLATGAEIEILLLKRLNIAEWTCLARPAKKLKPGVEVVFNEELRAVVRAVLEDGMRTIRFIYEGVFETLLERAGSMPLPPYITEKPSDPTRYQTVYSKFDGSAAAPTAGLHFTPQLLEALKEKGIEIEEVLLHVGLGTFRPVQTEEITQHKMHSEYFEISAGTAERINRAKQEGRRVIAVGTTSVRVLESSAGEDGLLRPRSANTEIFIYPSYTFKVVDGLITNFHLPESTLIMLVSAFIGREKTLELYRTAVKHRYRFFSFGDAMLLL